MQSKGIVFLVILTFFVQDLSAQSTWLKLTDGSKNDDSDSIIINTSANTNNPITTKIDFDKIISQIKIPKFTGESFLNNLKREIDSLTTILPYDSSVQSELTYLNNELNSTFQILNLDSIGFALYGIDTFRYENFSSPIYLFTTNLRTEWNEDHSNWYLYYAAKFGLIKCEYHCFESFDPPCFDYYELIDSPTLESKQKLIIKKMLKEAKWYSE